MFSKAKLGFLVLAILSGSETAFGRYRWMERDNKPVRLAPRRFGQEHPAVIDKLAQACGGGVCATLAGQAITPLLAAQPECSQQDMADLIIDTAAQFDDATAAVMIALAIEYRQAEKNTPPEFSTNPPTLRNSVFCQKAPKNSQLDGLVQAQDPDNDPEIFFDPATKASVKLGDQANTFPFGTNGNVDTGADAGDDADTDAGDEEAVATSAAEATATAVDCGLTVTVTVGATATADATTSAAVATSTAAAGDIGDFGSCSIPQIEFGVGFDGRRETSFQPVDKVSFNHGSAQNIAIITQFICDQLVNSCGADATAKATCAAAKAAADAGAAKTGIQADLFNAGFGIVTSFADVQSVDDQGRVVAGTGNTNNAAASTTAASSTSTGSASSGGIGDFGSCSVPQIEFGVGFDGRKETSFQPVDKASFNHGSAQNIAIITQFICDQLVNSCGANATAKATCATAKAAADAGAAKTGIQADLFNAGFGIKTNFAAVQSIDDQGRAVAGTGNGSAAAATTAATAAASTATAASSSGGIGDFGSCSVPQIEFGVGFDGRKETSFQPVDKASYNHGSAQNFAIISQFICDTLVNSCGADATARATCAAAKAKADAGTAKTGIQADLFNAGFGIKTNFAAITPIDNQGNPVTA